MVLVTLIALAGFFVIGIILFLNGRKPEYGSSRKATAYQARNSSPTSPIRSYKVSHSVPKTSVRYETASTMREAISKVELSDVPERGDEVASQENEEDREEPPLPSEPAEKRAEDEPGSGLDEAKELVSRIMRLRDKRLGKKKQEEPRLFLSGFGGFFLSCIGAVIFFLFGIALASQSGVGGVVSIIIALAFAFNAKALYKKMMKID